MIDQKEPQIYTIGHGNRAPELLLLRLETALAGKASPLVLDVRSHPKCTWEPRYSRYELEALLRAQGIVYQFGGRHLGGRPSPHSFYVGRKLDYQNPDVRQYFYKGIELEVLPNLSKHDAIVLFCTEGNPNSCHRGKLLTPMLNELGFVVRHLLPSGSYNDVICAEWGSRGSL